MHGRVSSRRRHGLRVRAFARLSPVFRVINPGPFSLKEVRRFRVKVRGVANAELRKIACCCYAGCVHCVGRQLRGAELRRPEGELLPCKAVIRG